MSKAGEGGPMNEEDRTATKLCVTKTPDCTHRHTDGPLPALLAMFLTSLCGTGQILPSELAPPHPQLKTRGDTGWRRRWGHRWCLSNVHTSLARDEAISKHALTDSEVRRNLSSPIKIWLTCGSAAQPPGRSVYHPYRCYHISAHMERADPPKPVSLCSNRTQESCPNPFQEKPWWFWVSASETDNQMQEIGNQRRNVGEVTRSEAPCCFWLWLCYSKDPHVTFVNAAKQVIIEGRQQTKDEALHNKTMRIKRNVLYCVKIKKSSCRWV